MYNNQYPDSSYSSSYPAYSQNYGYNYQGYTQSQFNTTLQPGPPGEEYPHNNWTSTRGYPNVGQPANLQQPLGSATDDGKKEAVAQEIQQQKTQLIKQREEYVRKVLVLRRELDLLKNQKQELVAQASPVRDRDGIIRENEKLQDEILTKIKAIHNVIEMLSSIIKDGKNVHDLEAELDEENSPRPKVIQSEKLDRSDGKFNYVHYDPELHWCRDCDKFPQTAKEFLLHLQTEKHKSKVQENDAGDNTPWHKLAPEPELPTYEGAPKRRVPIKGLQFFISAPSWYCKLCDTWIGDLHCASHHLKSQAHFQNYANFVEQNPHWEMEWLKDREKVLSRTDKADSDCEEDFLGGSKKKKKRDKQLPVEKLPKEKKKKKHSKKRRRRSSDTSSSSSSSDTSSEEECDGKDDRSKSIRVAMRNVKVQSIMNEDLTGKWEMLGRLVEEHKKKEEALQKAKHQSEDNLISQWMTVSEPPEKEKVMLDNLKDRMKQKQEAERARAAELERKRREKEREERESLERKQREAREQKEREDRERKQHEIEEYERIRDHNRDHVKFKASRDRFRKRLASGSSDEESGSKHSRSTDSRHYSSSSRRRSSPDRHKRNDSGKRERGGRSSPHKTKSRTPPRSQSTERHKNKHDENKRDENKRDENKRDENKHDESKPEEVKKKPPGPPSYKKLPFIGRMPLFKNKKSDEKNEKEIKKEEYETPRQTRFQPGNLARAFIPEPEVVCFPKLATIPPLVVTPPTPTVPVRPPAAPKITEQMKAPKAPPPPKIYANNKNEEHKGTVKNNSQEFTTYEDTGAIMSQYYPPNPDFSMMYPQLYDFSQNQENSSLSQEEVPHAHTMPLLPPPLPPAGDVDDLALLGISADDMAAQSF